MGTRYCQRGRRGSMATEHAYPCPGSPQTCPPAPGNATEGPSVDPAASETPPVDCEPIFNPSAHNRIKKMLGCGDKNLAFTIPVAGADGGCREGTDQPTALSLSGGRGAKGWGHSRHVGIVCAAVTARPGRPLDGKDCGECPGEDDPLLYSFIRENTCAHRTRSSPKPLDFTGPKPTRSRKATTRRRRTRWGFRQENKHPGASDNGTEQTH